MLFCSNSVPLTMSNTCSHNRVFCSGPTKETLQLLSSFLYKSLNDYEAFKLSSNAEKGLNGSTPLKRDGPIIALPF